MEPELGFFCFALGTFKLPCPLLASVRCPSAARIFSSIVWCFANIASKRPSICSKRTSMSLLGESESLIDTEEDAMAPVLSSLRCELA